ncbi:MAG: AI-2E family transporter [Myxococcales bacterium]|nr:AI-2E family transporter [Myxococcales bacterium]
MTSGGAVNEPTAAPRSPLILWLRRFARLWGFGLFILIVLVVFRAVVLPFILGIAVAYVLTPIVSMLSTAPIGRSWRVPRWLAIVAVYLGLLTAFGVFFTLFLPRLSSDFARLFREAPTFLSRVKRQYVPRADAWLDANFPREEDPVAAGSSPPTVEEQTEPRPERKIRVTEVRPGQYEISLENLQLEVDPTGRGRYVVGPRSDADEKRTRLTEMLTQAARAGENELRGIIAFGQRFIGVVIKGFAWFILTFMVAAYLLIDTERVMGFLRSLVPAQHRFALDELLREIDRGLSGIIRGQLIICVVNALLTTVGLLLFRVKYAVLLGMLAGAFSFIPVFGSILSSVPIVAVALASGANGFSLSTGLGMLGWIVGIHLVEANLLNPKIIGTAAKMHPVVVVFALMVGEETGGLIGAILAVPIASIVQAIFLYFRRRQPLAEDPRSPTSS